jgi:hypothetical protein
VNRAANGVAVDSQLGKLVELGDEAHVRELCEPNVVSKSYYEPPGQLVAAKTRRKCSSFRAETFGACYF